MSQFRGSVRTKKVKNLAQAAAQTKVIHLSIEKSHVSPSCHHIKSRDVHTLERKLSTAHWTGCSARYSRSRFTKAWRNQHNHLQHDATHNTTQNKRGQLTFPAGSSIKNGSIRHVFLFSNPAAYKRSFVSWVSSLTCCFINCLFLHGMIMCLRLNKLVRGKSQLRHCKMTTVELAWHQQKWCYFARLQLQLAWRLPTRNSGQEIPRLRAKHMLTQAQRAIDSRTKIFAINWLSIRGNEARPTSHVQVNYDDNASGHTGGGFYAQKVTMLCCAFQLAKMQC